MIRYFFPSIILVGLFSPFIYNLDILTLIGLAVLFGYVTEPLQNLIREVYFALPKVKNVREKRNWHANNWNYDRLYFVLSSREQDYLLFEQSYLFFYTSVGFYAFTYFLTNISILLIDLIKFFNYVIVKTKACFIDQIIILITHALEVKTPLIGGADFSSVILAAIFFLVSYACYRSFLRGYDLVFNYLYPQFSAKYHGSHGEIARTLFGRVMVKKCLEGKEEDQPVAQAEVHVKHPIPDFIEPKEDRTDTQGRYQINVGYCDIPYEITIQKEHFKLVKFKQKLSRHSVEYDKKIYLTPEKSP